MRKKQITRCALLAVFAVVSITAVLVSRHEEKVEQIKNSDPLHPDGYRHGAFMDK